MGIPGVVDLGSRSADQLEREASSLEPGWFKAVVKDAYLDDGNLALEFRLDDGRQHTEKLWDPSASEKWQRLQERRDAFAVRLGLVPREAKGTAYEFDWLDAIGKDVAIELVWGKVNDKGQRYIQLAWMGLYDIGDGRVPEAIRNGASFAGPGAAQPATDGKVKKGAKSSSSPASSAQQSRFNLDDL